MAATQQAASRVVRRGAGTGRAGWCGPVRPAGDHARGRRSAGGQRGLPPAPAPGHGLGADPRPGGATPGPTVARLRGRRSARPAPVAFHHREEVAPRGRPVTRSQRIGRSTPRRATTPHGGPAWQREREHPQTLARTRRRGCGRRSPSCGAVAELRGQVEAPRQAGAGSRVRLAEVDVERLNVLEPDGTPRLVLSDRERAPDPSGRRDALPARGGNPPGLLFYNDEGDECGGLIFSGPAPGRTGVTAPGRTCSSTSSSRTRPWGSSTTTATGSAARGSSSRTGNPPPALPRLEALTRWEAARALSAGPERERALDELRAGGFFPARRVFVGRERDGAAVVRLCDPQGRVRLRLSVDTGGVPRLELLDEAGGVTHRLPEGPPASDPLSSFRNVRVAWRGRTSRGGRLGPPRGGRPSPAAAPRGRSAAQDVSRKPPTAVRGRRGPARPRARRASAPRPRRRGWPGTGPARPPAGAPGAARPDARGGPAGVGVGVAVAVGVAVGAGATATWTVAVEVSPEGSAMA